MLSTRIIFAGVCAAGGIAYLSSGLLSRADVEFTRPAPPPLGSVDVRPVQSSVFVTVPVDLSGVGSHAKSTLPTEFPAIKTWLPDAACARRTRWIECNTAKLEGTLRPAGSVDVRIEGDVARVRIPIKYDLTATGLGWARGVSEQKAGETAVTAQFAIRFDQSTGVTVTARTEPEGSSGKVKILKATLELSKLLEKQLQPVLKAVENELGGALSGLPVKHAVEQAWNTLARPMELGTGTGRWLKALPQQVTSGQFVVEDGYTMYRLAIIARVAIVESASNLAEQRSRADKAPVYGQADDAPTVSRIRLAIPVGLETMQQATAAAFAKAGQFTSRVDRFSKPIKVQVYGARVYPAARQIAVELDLEATTAAGQTVRGKAHLAGRPVVDLDSGTVTLTDVIFPQPTAHDRAQRRQTSGIPRLGTEPFASTFSGAARLDVSRAAQNALPRAMHMLNLPLKDRLGLRAELTKATPVSFELAADGAWLLVDVEGALTFEYDGRRRPPPGAATPAIATLAAAKPTAARPQQMASSSAPAKVSPAAHPAPTTGAPAKAAARAVATRVEPATPVAATTPDKPARRGEIMDTGAGPKRTAPATIVIPTATVVAPATVVRPVVPDAAPHQRQTPAAVRGASEPRKAAARTAPNASASRKASPARRNAAAQRNTAKPRPKPKRSPSWVSNAFNPS